MSLVDQGGAGAGSAPDHQRGGQKAMAGRALALGEEVAGRGRSCALPLSGRD